MNNNHILEIEKIRWDDIENIHVDCVIGFGAACSVATALKRNNLRFFSCPFDWMTSYSLDNIISVLENKGKDFFSDYSVDENYSSDENIGIRDNKTGMVSMHDFPNSFSLENVPVFFQNKYQKRFKNLDYVLKNAKHICIVTFRKITVNEIEDFINKFKSLYHFKHLYYINLYDSNEESFEKFEMADTTIMYYKLSNTHKNGAIKAENPYYWMGNTENQDNILKKIFLNKCFVIRYKIKKSLFDISKVYVGNNIRYTIILLGAKFKFKSKI